MILYDNGFLGQDFCNQTFDWCNGDTEERYLKSLTKQPNDWYYVNKKITYTYNNNGHRSVNVNDLNFDNYVLFTGCSHTEGVGLELETTYPYLISKNLNCDYYNLALSASGIDVLEYNILHWFLQHKKKPKYVFIQWPDHSRFMSVYPGYDHIIPNGSWCETDAEKRFFVSGELTGFFNARKFISLNCITNIIDVPFYTINLTSLATYDNNSFSWKKVDTARDLKHCGIKSHANLAQNLLDHLYKIP